MCHHRFVPPPVAYDSWGMLMTSIPHVSAMSFPKPSLSINYGQDEIRVPIRQPFISWLPGTPGTKKHLLLFIIFFFGSLSEQEQGKQRNEPKWICLIDVKKQWITKKKSARKRKCKVTERRRKEDYSWSLHSPPHQLPPGCHDDFLSRGCCRSAPPGGSWEIR